MSACVCKCVQDVVVCVCVCVCMHLCLALGLVFENRQTYKFRNTPDLDTFTFIRQQPSSAQSNASAQQNGRWFICLQGAAAENLSSQEQAQQANPALMSSLVNSLAAAQQQLAQLQDMQVSMCICVFGSTCVFVSMWVYVCARVRACVHVSIFLCYA